MKIELDKKNIIIITAGLSVIGIIIIYGVFYSPLMRKLSNARAECRKWETRVTDTRDFAKSAGTRKTEDTILTEDDTPLAISELTRLGKLKGVNYISMTPEEGMKKTVLYCEVLPIRIEIESSYGRLGEFLGALDEMKYSLIKVDSLEVTSNKKKGRDDKVDFTRIKTKLLLNMYLLGKKHGK